MSSALPITGKLYQHVIIPYRETTLAFEPVVAKTIGDLLRLLDVMRKYLRSKPRPYHRILTQMMEIGCHDMRSTRGVSTVVYSGLDLLQIPPLSQLTSCLVGVADTRSEYS